MVVIHVVVAKGFKMKSLFIALLLTSTVLFAQEEKKEPVTQNITKILYASSPNTEVTYYSASPIVSTPSQAVQVSWEDFVLQFTNAYVWDKDKFVLVKISEYEATHKKEQPTVVGLPVHIPPIRNGGHDTLIIVSPTLSNPPVKDK